MAHHADAALLARASSHMNGTVWIGPTVTFSPSASIKFWYREINRRRCCHIERFSLEIFRTVFPKPDLRLPIVKVFVLVGTTAFLPRAWASRIPGSSSRNWSALWFIEFSEACSRADHVPLDGSSFFKVREAVRTNISVKCRVRRPSAGQTLRTF